MQLSAACMPLGIVTSPYCQNYDLVILIASVIAFFKLLPLVPMSKPLRIACLIVVAACLLVFELPFYTFIHYTYLAHGLITINPFFVSLCVLSALFIWTALKVCASESAKSGLGSAGSGQAG
jgi:hypothetical protein